jgi:hypothetical protein
MHLLDERRGDAAPTKDKRVCPTRDSAVVARPYRTADDNPRMRDAHVDLGAEKPGAKRGQVGVSEATGTQVRLGIELGENPEDDFASGGVSPRQEGVEQRVLILVPADGVPRS